MVPLALLSSLVAFRPAAHVRTPQRDGRFGGLQASVVVSSGLGPSAGRPAELERTMAAALDDAALWATKVGHQRYVSAPVTNRTLILAKASGKRATRLVAAIEAAAAMLEASEPPLQLSATDADARASGTWLLRYSNADEITNLDRLPLGLGIERVYQRVSLARGVVENRALVRHRWRLARQLTRVVARAAPAAPHGLNRAGVRNAGNRLEVTFLKVVVQLRRVLGIPTPFLRIVARPNGPNEKEGRTPTLDLTYVSDAMRVSRGGDGSLYVLERRPDEEVNEPLEELETVVDARRGFDGTTGKIERL